MATTPRDLATALEELGIKVEREDSDEVHAKCPKHYERIGEEQRKPHWSVNKETGYHNCFSCHYSGTFHDLVMDFTDLDVFEAWRWIRRHGVRLLTAQQTRELRYERAMIEDETEKAIEVTEASLALFYRPPLEQVYLRNLTMESIERYDMLWDIEEQGWIIPVRLPTGDLIGWQFKSKRDFENYPMSMEKGLCVFGLDLVEPGQTALVIEAPHDCCRVYDAGIEPEECVPVSSMGAGVTDAQMSAILNVTDSVIMGLDNDHDGMLNTQIVAMGEEKRGKVKRHGWANRFRDFRVYNYYGSRAKDQGDQNDEEILFGIRNAETPVAMAMGRYKDWSKDKDDDTKRGRRPVRKVPQPGAMRVLQQRGAPGPRIPQRRR